MNLWILRIQFLIIIIQRKIFLFPLKSISLSKPELPAIKVKYLTPKTLRQYSINSRRSEVFRTCPLLFSLKAKCPLDSLLFPLSPFWIWYKGLCKWASWLPQMRNTNSSTTPVLRQASIQLIAGYSLPVYLRLLVYKVSVIKSCHVDEAWQDERNGFISSSIKCSSQVPSSLQLILWLWGCGLPWQVSRRKWPKFFLKWAISEGFNVFHCANWQKLRKVRIQARKFDDHFRFHLDKSDNFNFSILSFRSDELVTEEVEGNVRLFVIFDPSTIQVPRIR